MQWALVVPFGGGWLREPKTDLGQIQGAKRRTRNPTDERIQHWGNGRGVPALGSELAER